MKKIWIPEPMYRAFPVGSIVAGFFFCVIMPSGLGLTLCGVLVGYGVVVFGVRAVG